MLDSSWLKEAMPQRAEGKHAEYIKMGFNNSSAGVKRAFFHQEGFNRPYTFWIDEWCCLREHRTPSSVRTTHEKVRWEITWTFEPKNSESEIVCSNTAEESMVLSEKRTVVSRLQGGVSAKTSKYVYTNERGRVRHDIRKQRRQESIKWKQRNPSKTLIWHSLLIGGQRGTYRSHINNGLRFWLIWLRGRNKSQKPPHRRRGSDRKIEKPLPQGS